MKHKTDICLGLHLTLNLYRKTQACGPSLELQLLTEAVLVEVIKNKTFFIVFNVSSFLAAEYPSLQLNSLPFPRTCNFALFLLYVTTEIMKVCRLGFYLLFVQFCVRNKLFISFQFTVEATYILRQSVCL
jgi:hypothetical protein